MCCERPLRNQRLSFVCLHTHVDFLPRYGRRSVREFSRGAIDLGIVRAPYDVARPDAMELHGSAAEGELDRTVPARLGAEHASAFFRFLRTSPVRGIEDETVARFDWRDSMSVARLDDDAITLYAQDLAHFYTAM